MRSDPTAGLWAAMLSLGTVSRPVYGKATHIHRTKCTGYMYIDACHCDSTST